jgi:hypothetical protein
MVNSFVHRLGANARYYRIAARATLRIDFGANPLNCPLAIGATFATQAWYRLPVLLNADRLAAHRRLLIQSGGRVLRYSRSASSAASAGLKPRT